MNKEVLNILMLEDNELDAELNQEQLNLLEEYDCKVKVIKNKDEYLKEITSPVLPDLILCDYNLPMFNGMDALNELNSHKLLIPFIFVTGAMQEEIAADAIKAGAWDYVVKDRLFRLPLAIRSVLELKKERDTIREAEKQISRLLQSINQTSVQVFITDQNNIIEYVNEKVCSVTGYSIDELVGKHASLFGLEDNEPETEKNMLESIKRGEVFSGELTGRHKNDNIFYELVTITPIKDINGEITNYIGVKEDITERKTLEENLKKSLEELQVLNRDLEIAKNKAEENDKLKTAFLANLSHEIRTPMNGILGFTDLIKTGKLSPDKISSYIDIIDQSGERLIHLIDDLIYISQIEADQVSIKPENTQLNKLIDGIYKFFKPQVVQKGLLFTCEKELDDSVQIYIDSLKLEQILSNLLNNAIKFTAKGNIHLKYSVSGKDIFFSVRDSGAGIAPDKKKMIFERFIQADNSYLKATEGMGLGLSISKSFVEKMGGKMWVESEVGKGSEFTFSLPFITPKKEEKEITNSKLEFDQEINILVAEDEEINYMYLEEMVGNEKTKLFHAWDGEEAIRLFDENPQINLVLMDLKMPNMNGVDATSKIREKNTNMPIIALTAYVSDKDRQAALDAGCTDFVTKPVVKDILLERIALALGNG